MTEDSLQLKGGIQKQLARSGAVQDALLRLATNSNDACALVAVYERCSDQLRAMAIRRFGKDAEVRAKAINSLLAAISRHAPTYDPQSADATEWIHRCADAEARKLREALNGRRGTGPQRSKRSVRELPGSSLPKAARKHPSSGAAGAARPGCRSKQRPK